MKTALAVHDNEQELDDDEQGLDADDDGGRGQRLVSAGQAQDGIDALWFPTSSGFGCRTAHST